MAAAMGSVMLNATALPPFGMEDAANPMLTGFERAVPTRSAEDDAAQQARLAAAAATGVSILGSARAASRRLP